ncbi:MAG: hypothetical protein AAF401_19390, partial [Pseudomonadota bacterium]
WMFGSLHLSEPERELEFGLTPDEKSHPSKLIQIYMAPILEIGSITGGRIRSLLIVLRKSAARLL